MPPEIVTAETLSLGVLAKLYESAFLEVSWEEDSELLKIHDDLVAEASVESHPDRLVLIAFYGISEEADEVEALRLINRINQRSSVLSASLDDERDLSLSYSILLKGGVTKRAIVESTRLFLREVPRMIEECDELDIVE